jgi:predicted Zn-dependent peptidase
MIIQLFLGGAYVKNRKLSRSVIAVSAMLLFFVTGVFAGTEDMFKTYLEDQIQEFTLDNGMKFILIERTQIPVFSAIVLVGVGSVDEPPGKTGVAHVFEHMAFKGTTTIGTRDYEAEKVVLERIETIGGRLTELLADSTADPEQIEILEEELEQAQEEHSKYIVDNELDEIYSRNGANFMNAGTGRDFTVYMVSLPANRLELWARVEADRLMNPVFRQFYEERDVIKEERRMGTDNSATGDLYEEFSATAFRVHPYGDPVIGWMHDIRNLVIDDTRHLYQQYYVPENITVAIAGDIGIDELETVAKTYFSQIPARPMPDDRIPHEPPQNHVRKVRVVRDDATPNILMGWHMPRYPNNASVALDIAAQILADGRTSRLYKRLVETDLAVSISANAETMQRYDGLFTIGVVPRTGVEEQIIIDAITDEIQGLIDNPPTKFEIERIRKQEMVGFIRRLETNMWLAMQLAYFENLTGDWRYIGQYLRDLNACSTHEVSQAVQTYLGTRNYTLAILEKPVDDMPEIPLKDEEDA